MNSLVGQFELLHGTNKVRDQLLEALADEELAFRLPNDNPPLGELFREMGEVEHAYVQGFKTFQQDFSYRHADPTIATSTERLAAWYKALDAELEAAISAMSEDDLKKTISRPHWEAPVTVMFHTYREAILIFGAKVSVYFKALKKPLPQQALWWIG